MSFYYKAKTNKGEIIEGNIEATDRFAVAKDLFTNGSFPILIVDSMAKPKGFSLSFNIFPSRVKVDEQIMFTKNLSGMLKAGLSLARALSVLEKQTKNKTLNNILGSIRKEIDRGETFSDSLAKFPKVFSHLFVSMVRAGEESGNMSGALSEIGMNLEKANVITKKVKGALMYPSVILGVMVIIAALMFAFVVPTLAKTFEDVGGNLPASTQLIINIGNLFSQHFALMMIGLFGFGFGFIKLVRAKFMGPYIDKIVVKLPLIGTLVKELNTARTARTLSSLITSGVPITRAIEITEDVVQNIYYKKVLAGARISVEKGSNFSDSFKKATDLYPVMMGEMMEVGEETGKLSDMLLEIALFYETEVENKTKNLSTIVEPLLMVIIGAAVGFFAVSMISPMYSVMDTIN